MQLNHSVSLFCPAQAYPVPIFRWETFIIIKIFEVLIVITDQIKKICYILPISTFTFCFCILILKNIFCWTILLLNNQICLKLEPVGSVKPRVNFEEQYRVGRVESYQTITLFCPAQSYPVPFFRYFSITSYARFIQSQHSLFFKTFVMIKLLI